MSGDYLPERTTYDFAPETPRQRQNRARLAAIMAQQKPAIEAPRGIFDLKEAGIKTRKPRKEIFEMSANGNGTAVMTGLPKAAADAGVGLGDMEKDMEVMTRRPGAVLPRVAAAPAAAAPAPPQPKRKGRKRQELSEELVRTMHARYVEIGSLTKTAKEHGRNASYLGRQFKKLGLPVQPHGGGRRGKGQKPARAAKPAALPSPPSDEVVRQIHADWVISGGELLPVAMRYRIDQGILRKRFKALGLAYPRRAALPLPVVDLRQPYEPPTVTALPQNGSDKPFAGHIEKVTFHNAILSDAAVAAAFEEGVGVGRLAANRDDVGAQTPVPAPPPAAIAPPKKPAPPPDYRIMHMLVDYLPADGRWTLHERELWLKATEAVLPLCVKEIEARP